MARLLIHGVPDTPAMWGPVLDALGEDAARTPALPGFVDPPPPDFSATLHAYADWLAEQVDALYADSGPVDLVGHDWGALLTLRVAHTRRDRIRTWVAIDAAFDPAYRGHLMAWVMNAPVVGELAMALSRPSTTALFMRASGVPREAAVAAGRHVSAHMKRCMLRLYRSARGLADFEAWQPGLGAMAPRGLLVWGERDPFVPLDIGRRVAERVGVPLHVERGAGHWTPLERPAEIAAVLRRHWAGG